MSQIDDRASSFNYSIFDILRSYWKLRSQKITCGKNVIFKSGVELRLTDNAKLIFGDNCIVQNYAFFHLTKPSPVVSIGNDVVIGRYSIIAIKNQLRIGNYVRIGSFVQIIDHDHSFKKGILIKNQKASIKNITIGNDVWIGTGVKILKGVTIGNGAVLGANSVITKDVKRDAVMAGVPAELIKYRTD